jgi:hypothetical protein
VTDPKTGADQSPHPEPSATAGAEPDERARRRKRTEAYFNMWGVSVTIPADVIPVPDDGAVPVSVEQARGRALANCLLALRGQGLSQLEAFAFADAYEVWDHLTFDENQLILTEEPSGDAMLQAAWRYERLWVQLWALGVVRHMAFPDAEVDTSKALELCISRVALTPADSLQLNSRKDLLDAADIAWSAPIVMRAGASSLSAGVVHERAAAYDELFPGWRS